MCVTRFNAHCVCVKNSVDVCVTSRATLRRFNVNEVKSSHQSIVLLIFFYFDCLFPRRSGRRYRATTAVKTNRWSEHVFIAHWNDIVGTLHHHNWQTATKRNKKKGSNDSIHRRMTHRNIETMINGISSISKLNPNEFSIGLRLSKTEEKKRRIVGAFPVGQSLDNPFGCHSVTDALNYLCLLLCYIIDPNAIQTNSTRALYYVWYPI